MMSLFERLRRQPGCIMVVNFLVLMAVYMLSRWFFYYINIASFPDVTWQEMMTIWTRTVVIKIRIWDAFLIRIDRLSYMWGDCG